MYYMHKDLVMRMQVHLEFITLNCHGICDAYSIAGAAYIHQLEGQIQDGWNGQKLHQDDPC